MSEYRNPTTGVRPSCATFTAGGTDGRHFPWAQLSGHELYYSTSGGNFRENPYAWAIVTDDLRGGIDGTYENYLVAAGIGVALTSAYRTPTANAAISHRDPKSVNSWHLLGRAADMRPADPSLPRALPENVWNALRDAALAAGAPNKVRIEDRLDSQGRPQSVDHVHATFRP
jgi:hypothetical protein